MRAFRLILEIETRLIEHLRVQGALVAVARAAAGALPSTLWLGLSPARRAAISWQESYGMYAAEVPPHRGDPIHIICCADPSRQHVIHPFSGTAFGDAVESPAIPPGHFVVRNDTPRPFVFGLAQHALINGKAVCAPVNAAVVAPALRADFVACKTVYVWMDRDTPAVGSIEPRVPPHCCALPVVNGRMQRLRYDSGIDAFVPILTSDYRLSKGHAT